MMSDNNFFDYRKYLTDYLHQKKQSKPSFSIGMWAKQLGLLSTASLSKVLNGEREAGKDLVNKFIHYFKMDEYTAQQFKNSVAVSKLKVDKETKIKIISRIMDSSKTKKVNEKIMTFDYAKLLKNPLPLALRELSRTTILSLKEFKAVFSDYSEKEIKAAIDLLLQMNMIQKNEKNKYYAQTEHVATTDDISSDVIQRYHKMCLRQAEKKILQTPILEREFQALMFLMNSKDMPKYKEKIRDFLNTIENDIRPNLVDQLYQIQIQFFPLSQKMNEVINPNTQS
jgi:uncharacterized protein (TIGR02147 family)